MSVKDWLNSFSEATYGKPLDKCKEEGICVACHEVAIPHKDYLTAREYTISGMCGKCQDKVFYED